jgi:Zn-dependent protease with chaperone function
MRWILGCLLLWSLPLRAEGIAEVLERSAMMRLAQRGEAASASPAAARVQASFQRLQALAPLPHPVELRLVGGGLHAEAIAGRLLAVSETVGDLPEGERLLLLAHEMGHLALGHWRALSGLYLRHIPGEVRPDTTDPVAGVLGAQAHALSHQQEYEADAHGYALVRRLGFGVDNALALLLRNGMQPDGATHPGTRRRLAQLRALEARLQHEVLHPEGAEAVAAAQ